jgi:selenoprotein W-related protein
LSTFDNNIGEVVLIPCKLGAGTFIIRVNGDVIWNRSSKETPGFPELKILKQLIRDKIAPDFSLGHSETKLET